MTWQQFFFFTCLPACSFTSFFHLSPCMHDRQCKQVKTLLVKSESYEQDKKKTKKFNQTTIKVQWRRKTFSCTYRWAQNWVSKKKIKKKISFIADNNTQQHRCPCLIISNVMLYFVCWCKNVKCYVGRHRHGHLVRFSYSNNNKNNNKVWKKKKVNITCGYNNIQLILFSTFWHLEYHDLSSTQSSLLACGMCWILRLNI